MIGASCTSGHPSDRIANHTTTIEPTSSTSQQLTRLTNHVRSEGAAEPPSASTSEVRLNDPLVALDEAGRPLGDLLAVVEHEHRFAEPHHDLHVVLDQEDRAALVAQPADG